MFLIVLSVIFLMLFFLFIGTLLFCHFYDNKKHHHHHVVQLARISLSPSLSQHFFPFVHASDRSSGRHPVSSHSFCMYILAGRPAFARPYVVVHRSTSLMSSSLLLKHCPACLVCLTWIVFVMGGRWPYSLCLVGCCRLDLFNIACNKKQCESKNKNNESLRVSPVDNS